MNNGKLRSFCK